MKTPFRSQFPLKASLAFLLTCLMAVPAFTQGGTAAGPLHTIILVRHGAYDINRSDPDASPLNPLGIAQARLVGARLGSLPGRTDALISSPVIRAHQTARVIAADIPGRQIELLPGIAECTPPSRRPETAPKTDEQARAAACSARLDSAFTTLFVPASTTPRRTIIVAHGNSIRYLVTRMLGVDTKAWLEMSVGNASITQVLIEPDGRFKVTSVGDLGHLPPTMHTGITGLPERPLVVP